MLKGLLRRVRRRFYAVERPRIFFVHVPKCGGTSLDLGIREACDLFEHERFGLSGEAVARLARSLGKSTIEIEQVLSMYAVEHREWRYFSGHVAFDEQVMAVAGSEWKFITLLRDPVKRWFSHFFFKKYVNRNEYPIDESLCDFVETSRAAQLAQSYLRIFQGRPLENITDVGAATQRALANLARFEVVGTLENLDGFCRDFGKAFSCQLHVPKENVHANRPEYAGDEVTPEIRQRVSALCAADQALYDFARQRSG